MSRFNAIIDFRGQQLILRPGKRIRDSFSQNMTGLEVTQPIRNLPYYVVDRVEPSSPGEEAGIITGDEIAYLNGNPASTFTLESIRRFSVLVQE
jgi:C-terminal processing protease CtpA/Prc